MKNKETTMTLDSPSNTGRPGLDELVPSRYALKVGEIDVLVISDGVLSLPGEMLGHNADPAVRASFRSMTSIQPQKRTPENIGGFSKTRFRGGFGRI